MNFFQRLQDVLGLSEQFDQYDYIYDYEEEPEEYTAPHPEQSQQPVRAPISTNNVIEMPGMISGQMEVVLMEPRSFEAVSAAIVALRERKAVILNLSLMDADQAQRSVDYIAGGTFAIDGDQERLGEKVFLFTPSFVRISRTASVKSQQDLPASQSEVSPSPRPSGPTNPSRSDL